MCIHEKERKTPRKGHLGFLLASCGASAAGTFNAESGERSPQGLVLPSLLFALYAVGWLRGTKEPASRNERAECTVAGGARTRGLGHRAVTAISIAAKIAPKLKYHR